MNIPSILKKISIKLNGLDAKAIVVGGSVRDFYLQCSIKDYDIEVYGLKTLQELENILKEYGLVKLVGKSFGVLKFIHESKEYDFSFPRTERKSGVGHKGFEVKSDGFMSFNDAAKRRDFTINAMGYDIKEEKFLDPFSGITDIENRVLKHIDDKTFIEDPLRLYRGVQFCARFEYIMHNSTKELCIAMTKRGDLKELAKERIFDELKKLLLKAKKPSIGFKLLREFGVLKYFPELKALIGVKQEEKWHPEGDVWIHTMMSLDEMSKLLSVDAKRSLILMLCILCHDFGKPSTTKFIDGRIRALGHENAGLKPTESFITRLSDEVNLIESVLPLVKYHLTPSMLFRQNASDKAIRRLATKVNIKDLELVARADFFGRTTTESKSGIYEAGDWLLEKASRLRVENEPLKKLLFGRDLISLGMKPSKQFSLILDYIYELQLDGKINTKDEALEYIRQNFSAL